MPNVYLVTAVPAEARAMYWDLTWAHCADVTIESACVWFPWTAAASLTLTYVS